MRLVQKAVPGPSAILAACGHYVTEPTGPSGYAGTYTLTSMNGAGLPAYDVVHPSFTVISGTLELQAGGYYVQTFRDCYTYSGSVCGADTVVYAVAGEWTDSSPISGKLTFKR